MKVEKGGKLAYVGVFIILLGLLQDFLIGNFLITMVATCIGGWVWLRALQMGPCFPIFVKFPRWHKWEYYSTLVLNVLLIGGIIVALIGVLFFGWELR